MSAADAIAIVGLACRAPAARDAAQLWSRILAGNSSLSEVQGVDGEVNVRGVLADADCFDAGLFGISDREASQLDRQHRVFLELCWHALEDAGIDPFRADGAISVYASCSPPAPRDPTAGSLAAQYDALMASEPDFLAARVSHTLDLRGESIVVQTGCSSSLVAVHLACASLLAGASDVALAGGVTIAPDQTRGYRYQPEMIFSPDGRCRPFDERARGTVPGSGGGVVVLKRLDDALRDREQIHAVVRGTGVNNDGSHKASFMAPSVAGQAEAVATALAVADVAPESVGLIETHGTATTLGDEVEIEALKRAYVGSRSPGIAIGSIKGSIGHLDRAAGIIGLIKATLAVAHGTIPPAPGSERPRAELRLEESPFYLPQDPRSWPASLRPRRAGVSSLGVGGTNVHVVIEEAPRPPATGVAGDGPHVVTVSAAALEALSAMRLELAHHLEESDDAVAAVAATRNLRRPQLELRSAVVGRDAAAIARALRSSPPVARSRRRPVVFMFQGHGLRFPDFGFVGHLAEWSTPFREALDACEAALASCSDIDLRPLWHADAPTPSRRLLAERVEWADAALFALEYALAHLWRSAGVDPDVVVGPSVGELAAATVAGVFELPDALALVTERGKLLDAADPAPALSVALGEEALVPLLPAEVEVAEVNGPQVCVVAGAEAAVAALESELAGRGVSTRRSARRRAGKLAETLRSRVSEMKVAPPDRVLVSSVTAAPVAPEEVTTADYWVRQLRDPVRVSSAIETAAGEGALLVELGQGRALATLADRGSGDHAVVVALGNASDPTASVLQGLAAAWAAGTSVAWERVHGERAHVRLPFYPFDHSRTWTAPSVTAPPPSGGFENGHAPRRGDSVAATLAEIWQEVLGVERVGDGSDFFEAGGESLVALDLSAGVADQLGVELPVRTILETPRFSDLVAVLETSLAPA
jgi:phthiocerol/phenolphthiocerol synthesis type-I polyketide synthase E